MVHRCVNCPGESAVHKYLLECVPAACMSEISTMANH